MADRLPIPPGYRIERDETRAAAMVGREVRFAIYERGDRDPLATVRATHSARADCWYVQPGSAGWIESSEARVRAAALVMAANECAERNGDPDG